MARKFLTNVDFAKNEIQNAKVQNLATAPESPTVGQIYFDTVLGFLRVWNGSAWVNTSQGIQGTQGTQGTQGIQGVQGTQGLQGVQGTDGLQGLTGDTGAQGTTGETGAQGTTGETGAQGTTGEEGIQGVQGTQGIQGPQGTQGIQGVQGTQGIQGETGTQGLDGLQGTQGVQGTQGIQGITGIQGTDGLQGTTGSDATVTAGQGINVAGGVVSIDETYTATRAYVDSVAEGLHVHASVKAATTAALTGSVTYDNGTAGVGATLTLGTALSTLDGYTLLNGDRILIKNQATQAHNGIYTWATGGTVLTRATDYDTAAEIDAGDFFFVQNGTVNADSGFVQTETITTVGTDAVSFTQFSGAGTYQGGAGLTLDGNVFNVGAGTGISVATDTVGIDTTTVARKHTSTIGDGEATSYTITHNFNTRGVIVSVYESSGEYNEVEAEVEKATANTVIVKFTIAPAENAYVVAVIG